MHSWLPFNNLSVSAGLKEKSLTFRLKLTHNCKWTTQHNNSLPTTGLPHLFEPESKEAVALCADRHTGEVWQRNAGLHLARLLVGQDEALLCQQEDPSCALRTRAETVRLSVVVLHVNIMAKTNAHTRMGFYVLFFLFLFKCLSDLETGTGLSVKHNTPVHTWLLPAGTNIMPVVKMSKNIRLPHSWVKYPSKQLNSFVLH